MKIRMVCVSFVLLVLWNNLALGQAGIQSGASAPRQVSRSASTSGTPNTQTPPTGPAPVNLLSAGLYLSSPNYKSAGLLDVAFGDFNGDGNVDVVNVDFSTCITFMPGDGRGHFSGAPIPSCVIPETGGDLITAGDFNNDGILDVALIASGCCNPNTINLVLAQGNGDGTFTYKNTISFCWCGGTGQLGYGELPTSLNAADLNHDLMSDIVLTTTGGNTNEYSTYVFLGSGNFNFSQTGIKGTGGCPGIAAGVLTDMNGDGNVDLATTTTACGLHEVDIYLGNGDGTFKTPVGYPTTTGGASCMAAGDINGDGFPDIAVTVGAGGNPITAFLGRGDGTLGTAVNSTSVYNPYCIALGDFNGDGKADAIVTSNYAGGDVAGVQFSNGDGTFQLPVQQSVITGPQRVFTEDVNADGHPDWIVIGQSYLYLSVGLSSGTGKFLAGVDDFSTPGTYGNATTFAIAAADLNKDGNLDYALVGGGGVYIAIGDGAGNLAPVVNYSAGGSPNQFTVADFNNDGYPDIAVTQKNSPGTVEVLLNNKNGTYGSAIGYSVGNGPYLVQAADFNKDGNLDLIVTNITDGTVSVLLGNGDGTFQTQKVSASEPSGSYMAVADFDGDGKLDVAVTQYSGSSTNIGILRGNGDGTFQAPLNTTGPQQATGITAGDFNNDGKMDLVVAADSINNGSGGSGGAAIFLGLGNGSFAAAVNYPAVPPGLSTGGGPTFRGPISLGDLNNDGFVDIVAPNYGSIASGINLGPSILLGKGDGTFTLNPAAAPVAGPNQLGVALGDFNHDGLLDVAVMNFDPGNDQFLNTVTMLLSTQGTEVVLTSSVNPSIQGQAVTFTATVETSFIGLPTPTGTITFELGSTNVPVTLVNGVATYTTSTLALGSTIVTAVYSGDTYFNTSTSLGLSQVVKPAPLVITTSSLPDGIQNVSYTASVMAGGGVGPYTFSIISGSLPTGLSLNSNGAISGTPTGLPGTSSFTVQAQDNENPPQITSANLSITVASNLVITTTNLPNGVAGNAYNATIAATGGIPPYTFSLSNGTTLPAGLSLSSSGVISGTPTTAGTSNFTVQVQDSANPAQSKTANFSITISAALSITTTTLPNGVQGTVYNASVMANGGIPPYKFALGTGTLPAGLSIASSGVISGSPTGVGTSNFTVKAKDSSTPAQTVTANLSITVASSLVITTTSLPNGVVGNTYNATVVASGGITPYTFSLTGTLPAGLSLSAGGVISGTPTSTGTTSFTVKVTDSTNPAQTATANLSITVNAALSITTTSLPNGVQGSAYNASVAVAGGVPPYTFTVSSGTLPAGLSLSAAGAISGTPSSVGTSNFTVKAVDSSNPSQSATANLSITITSSLVITTTSLPTGIVGNAYSAAVTASGGTPPYTFSLIGSLPAGLSLSTSGVISGIPSSTGTSSFTVKVQDSTNPFQSATANLSITITNALSITTTSLPDGVQGVAYSSMVVATGGIPPYTFSVIGALPAGLSLSSSGGISGTPTSAGIASFSVQAKDSSNPAQSVTVPFSIRIFNSLAVTTTSLPSGVTGKTYGTNLAASGGLVPYTFSVSNGSLPAGLGISGAGRISGTPSGSAGTSTFTVQVRDSAVPPQVSTSILSITIFTSLSITTTTLPNGVVGNAYNSKVTAFGGTQPYTFTVQSGTLPTGLTLSTSGTIAGIASAAGTSSFTVQATDSSSPMQTATAILSITVNPGLSISTTSLPGAVLGVPYNATVSATGGVPPYSFSDTLGSLPGGLTISTGGVISGTPTSLGVSNFTVQAADASVPSQISKVKLSIKVTADLAITTTGVPNGVFNVPYNAKITATGGTAPYTFTTSSGSLPAGLSLSSGGIISGTPSGTGTSTFTVQVQDSTTPPLTATANFSITVSGTLAITTPELLPEGVAGVPYRAKIVAVGGTPPYNFIISAGGLFQGLTLSSSGVISGTVPLNVGGGAGFDVQVTDSSSPVQMATGNFLLVIAAPLSISTTTLPGATAGSPYCTQIFSAGGSPPVSFSVVSGTLPVGLSMDSNGAVCGTPSGANGTSNFTVQAKDSAIPPQTATRRLSVIVDSPLVITTTSIPNGKVGVPYRVQLVATGGLQPYTWTVLPGLMLPPGLSLSTTGLISGTPTQALIYNVAVNVVDSSQPNQLQEGVYLITIAP